LPRINTTTMASIWDRKDLTDCYFFYNGTCTKMSECEYRHCRAALSGDDETPCIDWKLGKCTIAKCVNRHPNVTPKLKAQWTTERPILAVVTPGTKTIVPKKKVKGDSDFIVKSLEEILKEQKAPITPRKTLGKGEETATVRKTIRKQSNANSTATATPNTVVPQNSSNNSTNTPPIINSTVNSSGITNSNNNETGSPLSSPPLLSPASSSVSSPPPPSPPREERTISSTPSTATNNTSSSPKRGREVSDDSDADVDESPKAKRQKVDTLTNIAEHQQTEQHQEMHESTVAAIEPTVQEEQSDEEEEDEKMGNENMMDEETFRIEFEKELLQFRRIYGTSV